MDAPTIITPPPTAEEESNIVPQVNDASTSNDNNTSTPSAETAAPEIPTTHPKPSRNWVPPDNADLAKANPDLSKNQIRKLRRKIISEQKRAERSTQRKEKRHRAAAAKKVQTETVRAQAEAAGLDPVEAVRAARGTLKRPKRQLVPVTLIIDCAFEKYMSENELISLSGQVTRSYSENRNRDYKAHMYVSSFGGKMKERYDTTLNAQYKNWKDCIAFEGGFFEAAGEAMVAMRAPGGGKVIKLLEKDKVADSEAKTEATSTPVPNAERITGDPSVVYLTSDSPNTLDKLEPYTSYVIGGIVDKNREKGLCYKIARQAGVRTAKLPIGDYMVMASRQVLTTNQVVEIMLNWLECGNWGVAFQRSIPKRKGGRLKDEVAAAGVEGVEEDDIWKEFIGAEDEDLDEEMEDAADDDMAGDDDKTSAVDEGADGGARTSDQHPPTKDAPEGEDPKVETPEGGAPVVEVPEQAQGSAKS